METNCAGSCNIPKLVLVTCAQEVSALNTSDKQVLFMPFQGSTHRVTALALSISCSHTFFFFFQAFMLSRNSVLM